ncbi:unnamed protein product [Amoebophrya sp. A25]|nr:unnamed protein product [Amoebophrya sp. A25]|eukprot:GSA25T00021673001.1
MYPHGSSNSPPSFAGSGAHGQHASQHVAPPGVDPESLISFSNLEAVTRSIMDQLQQVQQEVVLVKQQVGEQDSLQARAEVDRRSMESRERDLEQRLEDLRQVGEERAATLAAVGAELDQTKARCLALERKVDFLEREKALQDNLVDALGREIKEKVGIGEFAALEAKNMSLATKQDLQAVNLTLVQDYTRREQSERLLQLLRIQEEKAETFCTKKNLHSYVDDVAAEIRGNLDDHFARKGPTEETIGMLSTNLQALEREVERFEEHASSQLGESEKQLAALVAGEESRSERLDSCVREVDEISARMLLLADRSTVDRDTAELRLSLETGAQRTTDLETQSRTYSEALARIDRTLLDSMSKDDLAQLQARLDKCMDRETATASLVDMREKLDFYAEKVEHYLNTEAERVLGYRIYDAQIEELKEVLCEKADKVDMNIMGSTKAPVGDTRKLADQADLLQRQLEYVAITTCGLSKLALIDPKAGEKAKHRAQQKTQILIQAEALWHWIVHNEAPSASSGPTKDGNRSAGPPGAVDDGLTTNKSGQIEHGEDRRRHQQGSGRQQGQHLQGTNAEMKGEAGVSTHGTRVSRGGAALPTSARGETPNANSSSKVLLMRKAARATYVGGK